MTNPKAGFKGPTGIDMLRKEWAATLHKQPIAQLICSRCGHNRVCLPLLPTASALTAIQV